MYKYYKLVYGGEIYFISTVIDDVRTVCRLMRYFGKFECSIDELCKNIERELSFPYQYTNMPKNVECVDLDSLRNGLLDMFVDFLCKRTVDFTWTLHTKELSNKMKLVIETRGKNKAQLQRFFTELGEEVYDEDVVTSIKCTELGDSIFVAITLVI